MLSSLMPLSNHFLLMINKLHPTGPNSVETHDALQLHNVKLLLWYYWYMMVHDGTWWYMMVHVMSYMHNIFDQIWLHTQPELGPEGIQTNAQMRTLISWDHVSKCIKARQCCLVVSQFLRYHVMKVQGLQNQNIKIASEKEILSSSSKSMHWNYHSLRKKPAMKPSSWAPNPASKKSPVPNGVERPFLWVLSVATWLDGFLETFSRGSKGTSGSATVLER